MRGGPLARLRALLQGEMALLILLATPTPTGWVPAQRVLPRGARALSLGRGACESGRAPGGRGRWLDVPGHLRDETAAVWRRRFSSNGSRSMRAASTVVSPTAE